MRAELAQRYARIEPVVQDVQLRAVGTRLEQAHEGTGWVESIGALLGRKPMPQWSDDDLAAFRLHSAELARRFRQVEEVALVQHVLPATAPLVRVSLTTPQGERSVVVEQPQWNDPMNQLRSILTTTLADYGSLSNEQRLTVLAEVLDTFLKKDTSKKIYATSTSQS